MKKNKYITFVTLGYEDGKYIDVVLWGIYKLSKVHCLSGEGFVEDAEQCPWIRVKRIHFSRIEE